MIDFQRFEVLTFDCYGTLIDWETGILQALEPVLRTHRVDLSSDAVLEAFARYEAEVERGAYRTYREVLRACLHRFGLEYHFTPTAAQLDEFGGSVEHWPAFPDSRDALRALKDRYKLAPITNCDDDLFAYSNQKLGVEFDWIITAQRVRAYKPNLAGFYYALGKIGLPHERVLHVAQSLFHDHVPAKAVGLTSVWIDRRHNKPGFGATPPADATPDLTMPDMATFAAQALKP